MDLTHPLIYLYQRVHGRYFKYNLMLKLLTAGAIVSTKAFECKVLFC